MKAGAARVFLPANFAPGLSTSLALMLHFGAVHSPVPPSKVSPKGAS